MLPFTGACCLGVAGAQALFYPRVYISYQTLMSRISSLIQVAGALACVAAGPPAVAEYTPAPAQQPMESIYNISVQAQDGSRVPLSTYRGKVLLIVNTATHCGFTPQYNALQELYAAHEAAGLVVLDFPCNQFGAQAPGSNEEIHGFCTRRFQITFPQFAKIEVNGPGAAPLYKFLTSQAGFGGAVKWNFTKFLIDREGNVVARFEPAESMESLKTAVEKLL